MKKQLKPIPQFNSDQEEADFWMNHDTTEYIDWSKAKIGYFPNLKPTSRLVSLRLPLSIIESARMEANKRDIPYQSLIKQILYWVFIQRGIDKGVAGDSELSAFFFQSVAQPSYRSRTVDKASRK